jgi:hypothetical protein
LLRERPQVDRQRRFDPLAVLDRGERKQLVDHLGHPVALRADRGDEPSAVTGRHRFAARLDHLGAAADARQRALQLVGQRVDVLLDVLLALESLAHRRERASEVAELAGGIRRRSPLARGHCVGVAAQRVELARQPPGGKQADCERDAEQHERPSAGSCPGCAR